MHFRRLSTHRLLATLTVPIISSSNQVIWQKKVAPDVQGRVFAIRRTIVLATPLLTYPQFSQAAWGNLATPPVFLFSPPRI